MRSEQQMLDLILGAARADARVRAVLLNGSRSISGVGQSDPFQDSGNLTTEHTKDTKKKDNAGGDPFQDFDIVYLVNDLPSFRSDPKWIDRFGERMILQLPASMDAPEGMDAPLDQPYAYLMQFMDGNRIDLTLYPLTHIEKLYEDSQTIVLLDKDGLLKPFPPASDDSYLPKPPTAGQFANCCNEFWWVSPYAAKGLWRGQLMYAKHAVEQYIRPQLDKMLVWHIGIQTGFSVSMGSGNKYIPKYLEPQLWEAYQRTWAGADEQSNWDALLAMGGLFRRCAQTVAAHFGYAYPLQDDERVSAHLRHVRALPRDAREIY